jgi:DNA mismatch endonuclease (patch repair protein)
MRRIRAKDTSPEMAVRSVVHNMGFRYRLHSPGLPGRPDLVLRSLKKIIDVRGCFWHKHGKCIDSHIPKSRLGYWEPKLRRNRERDEVNLKELRRMGWKVRVIWECETQNIERLATRLRRFLES